MLWAYDLADDGSVSNRREVINFAPYSGPDGMVADENGKMNRSLMDVRGELLVVSQFTLLGDCRKGRRPSFTEAAPPEEADRLYRYFVARAAAAGVPVKTGQFQANMDVSLINRGPVTLMLESR